MIDVKEIIRNWEEDEGIYRELGNIAVDLLKIELFQHEIKAEITFRTKEMLSLIKKIKQKGKTYNEITDKLGIRIICSFNHELKTIRRAIKKLFIIEKIDDKLDPQKFDRLTYRSIHYDVRLKPKFLRQGSFKKKTVFEIQIRTLNQHAWANSSHLLLYKANVDLPTDLNRKIYRLLSLYELADDEIENVFKLINKSPETFIYRFLNQLEGKFFKYAKVDYDKNTALHYIEKILVFLEEVENRHQIEKNLTDFIEKHKTKIANIFDDNFDYYYEKPLLTQPEIFLSWYCLKKYEFRYTEFWEENFDPLDLDYIKDVWGFSIETL